MPSDEAAKAVVARLNILQNELRPGDRIRDATVFLSHDTRGHYVIVVGIGTMFSVAFITSCTIYAQAQGGIRLSERARCDRMILQAFRVWGKVQKREKQEGKILENSQRDGSS